MKTFTLALNILGFAALFLAYTAAAESDRPAGVRRALQTYAGQASTSADPTPDIVSISDQETLSEDSAR